MLIYSKWYWNFVLIRAHRRRRSVRSPASGLDSVFLFAHALHQFYLYRYVYHQIQIHFLIPQRRLCQSPYLPTYLRATHANSSKQLLLHTVSGM